MHPRICVRSLLRVADRPSQSRTRIAGDLSLGVLDDDVSSSSRKITKRTPAAVADGVLHVAPSVRCALFVAYAQSPSSMPQALSSPALHGPRKLCQTLTSAYIFPAIPRYSHGTSMHCSFRRPPSRRKTIGGSALGRGRRRQQRSVEPPKTRTRERADVDGEQQARGAAQLRRGRQRRDKRRRRLREW